MFKIIQENLAISQALFCFDQKRPLLQSLHCFSLLSILVGRGRNIILAYTFRIMGMKNRQIWVVENDRLAYNGLMKFLPLFFISKVLTCSSDSYIKWVSNKKLKLILLSYFNLKLILCIIKYTETIIFVKLQQ
jgi:hypothetical protein